MEDSQETSPSSNNSSEELSSALQLSKGMSIFLDEGVQFRYRPANALSPEHGRELPPFPPENTNANDANEKEQLSLNLQLGLSQTCSL
ncbi:hypothetical protein P7K49_026958 [Saguinus oedipus]|uniref:Uncharacterized protein n=1 Tax=Saguinus oedipus TaxID=9490 RepID=A0ABQ9UGZ7_SAGOE|nr:hypothetical protein P7K49_026958 [Saguinus oedipus]